MCRRVIISKSHGRHELFALNSHNNNSQSTVNFITASNFLFTRFTLTHTLAVCNAPTPTHTGQLSEAVHWMYDMWPARIYIYTHGVVDQLNTHLKIQTYFPHEILSMCWNIKMKFINIFTQNSNSDSRLSIQLKDFPWLHVYACVCVCGIETDNIEICNLVLGKCSCQRNSFGLTISAIRCLAVPFERNECILIFVDTKITIALDQYHWYCCHKSGISQEFNCYFCTYLLCCQCELRLSYNFITKIIVEYAHDIENFSMVFT